MKFYLTIILFSTFVTVLFGQMPSNTPTPPRPENSRIENFGSSLKRYENKEQQHSQNKRTSSEADDGETIQVKTDLVISDVLVTDTNGKMIVGLKKADFVVKENDLPQTVEVFTFGESATIPRSIVLVIDYFGAQAPYLENSIEAAKLLVDELKPNDEMAIVTTDIKLRMDFTSDKLLLRRTLDLLKENVIQDWKRWTKGNPKGTREFSNLLEKKQMVPGSGAEFDTLLAVLNEMFDEENRQRIVVFQGDGNEIIWLKPDEDAPYKVSKSTRYDSGMKYTGKKAMRKFGFSEVKESIESSRATIYSVVTGIRFFGLSEKERKARAKAAFENTHRAMGFGEKYLPLLTRHFQDRDKEVHTAGQTAMFKVAELSGGFIGFIEKPEDAEGVYANIFENIKNRYVIGYYPTEQNQNGERRVVKIEVRGRPEYTVTGRKTYLPQ